MVRNAPAGTMDDPKLALPGKEFWKRLELSLSEERCSSRAVNEARKADPSDQFPHQRRSPTGLCGEPFSGSMHGQWHFKIDFWS
jgi:hypothetical protein